MKCFYRNWERCEVLTGHLWLCAGLEVTWRICGTGQNVLQYSFQTGHSSSPKYTHIFFPIAFLEEAFIRNIRITLCINRNTVINNNC